MKCRYSHCLVPLIWATMFIMPTFVCAGTTIRISTVLTVPLQPFGKYETPCPVVNKSGCVCGFPIINAYLRNSVQQNPNQVALYWIDDSSKFMQFHPAGLAVNALCWKRMQAANLVGWTFEEVGDLTFPPNSLRTLYQNMTISPIVSNAKIDVSSIYYNVVQRQIVTTVGGYTLAILVITDWSRPVYPTFDASVQLPPILAEFRSFYHSDLNVVIFGRPFNLDWRVMLNLDIDVLITGRAYNTSVVTAPAPAYFNGTGVVFRSSNIFAMSYTDINMDAWKASKTNFLTSTEIDLSAKVNFTQTPINDATYYDDLAWMQKQVDAANANDQVVGTCDHAVAPGENDTGVAIGPCRYTECAIGDWWSQVFYNAIENADVTIVNGGSFRGGFTQGNVKLSDIWTSYPYVDSTCSFYVYGIDLYDIIVYALNTGQKSEVLVPNSGPFAQYYGMKITFNPNLNGTKLISAQIKDPTTGVYSDIQRAKIYKVVATTYVCGGGDGYGFVNTVPGTIKQQTANEVHAVALQMIAKYGFTCPATDGRLSISTSTTPLIMKHMTQADCAVNTRWVASALDCVACDAGTSNSAPQTSTECTANAVGQEATAATVNIVIPIVVAVGAFVLLALIVGFCVNNYRRKLRERRLLEAAPTGLVTIVFTDVQGSTSLWDQIPDDMSVALDIHNRVIRETIPKFSGYEVKTIGDSFMIAFPSCQLAVECSVAIQLALLQEQWPEGILQQESGKPQFTKDGKTLLWGGIRVRMGMQVGEPEVVVDHQTLKVDYFGPMVNQAARVESKAHGGEICITNDVLAYVKDSNESENWNVNFLGEHSFKGVSAKIPVYSLHHFSHAERTYPPDKPLSCDKCQEPLKCPRCDADHSYDTRKKAKNTSAALGKKFNRLMSTISSVRGGDGASQRGSARGVSPHASLRS